MSGSTSMMALLAEGDDEANAIGAPEGVAPLRYAALRTLARRTVERLNALGIGRNDRVAIVLPNGPEMASAFVSVAAGATTAPLNPAYRAEEVEFYLNDLRAKALVLASGTDSPARAVAQRLGLPVVELHADRSQGAGWFTLEPLAPLSGTPRQGGFAEGVDTALVLHTSGTTSRPKIVPLLQR